MCIVSCFLQGTLDVTLKLASLAANTSASGTSGASGAGGVVTVVVVASASSASSTSETLTSAESTTDRAWLTLETVEALLTASQNTTLLLEVGHADSGKGGSGVVLSCVVVNLVDGHGGVDDGGLDSF